MSYSEYYQEFINAQTRNKGKYVMFGADIKGSKLLFGKEIDHERERLLHEALDFVNSIPESVEMTRFSQSRVMKVLILGDSVLFSVPSTSDLKEINRKFTEFLSTFPFEFHRGTARFDTAEVNEENFMEGLTWYYCWPFLEDMMKIKGEDL